MREGKSALEEPGDEPVRAGHVESDLVDLTGMSIADLREISPLDRSPRLLDQVRRARSNAMGGSNPPGRAE